MELLLVFVDIDDFCLSLFLVTEVIPLGQKRKRAPAKIITKPKKASDTLLNLFLFLLNNNNNGQKFNKNCKMEITEAE